MAAVNIPWLTRDEEDRLFCELLAHLHTCEQRSSRHQSACRQAWCSIYQDLHSHALHCPDANCEQERCAQMQRIVEHLGRCQEIDGTCPMCDAYTRAETNERFSWRMVDAEERVLREIEGRRG